MKKYIVILEFNKFRNTPRPLRLIIDNLYQAGFWNCFKYSEPLEKFLKSNNIQYNVEQL